VTDPVRVAELLPGVLAEVVERAGHGYERSNVATMTVMATKMPVHRPRLSWPVTTSSDLLDAGDCSGAGGSGMVRT
jgi:hypothetical protein